MVLDLIPCVIALLESWVEESEFSSKIEKESFGREVSQISSELSGQVSNFFNIVIAMLCVVSEESLGSSEEAIGKVNNSVDDGWENLAGVGSKFFFNFGGRSSKAWSKS